MKTVACHAQGCCCCWTAHGRPVQDPVRQCLLSERFQRFRVVGEELVARSSLTQARDAGVKAIGPHTGTKKRTAAKPPMKPVMRCKGGGPVLDLGRYRLPVCKTEGECEWAEHRERRLLEVDEHYWWDFFAQCSVMKMAKSVSFAYEHRPGGPTLTAKWHGEEENDRLLQEDLEDQAWKCVKEAWLTTPTGDIDKSC